MARGHRAADAGTYAGLPALLGQLLGFLLRSEGQAPAQLQ